MHTDHMFLPIRSIGEHALAPAPRDQWPATVPAVQQLLSTGMDFSPLTVLVGENGSGKSTILEAIAESFGLNVEGGTHNAMHRTQRTESGLTDHLQLVRGAGDLVDSLPYSRGNSRRANV